MAFSWGGVEQGGAVCKVNVYVWAGVPRGDTMTGS